MNLICRRFILFILSIGLALTTTYLSDFSHSAFAQEAQPQLMEVEDSTGLEPGINPEIPSSPSPSPIPIPSPSPTPAPCRVIWPSCAHGQWTYYSCEDWEDHEGCYAYCYWTRGSVPNCSYPIWVFGLRDGLGCFEAGTRIRMADGSEQVVEKIKEGDFVWNPGLNKGQKVKRMIAGPELVPVFEISYGNDSLILTKTHPVIVRAASSSSTGSEFRILNTKLNTKVDNSKNIFANEVIIKQAKDLTLKDELLGADGKWTAIKAIKLLPASDKRMVYNIDLESEERDPLHHLLTANGLISGDYFLQGQVEGEATTPN